MSDVPCNAPALEEVTCISDRRGMVRFFHLPGDLDRDGVAEDNPWPVRRSLDPAFRSGVFQLRQGLGLEPLRRLLPKQHNGCVRFRLGLLLVAVPAAYVLSRGTFRGRQTILNFFIFGMGVPIPLLFIPLVVFPTEMGLVDTLLA